MSIYTLVDDGYDVTVYRSLAKLVNFLHGEGVRVATDAGALQTKKSIRFEIETCIIARFYTDDEARGGWKYRVQKHA